MMDWLDDWLLYPFLAAIAAFMAYVFWNEAHPKPCLETDRIVKLGQCTGGRWGQCTAVTENGTQITAYEPFIEGETVCVRR